MELEMAIKNILDGNALIIMGAGASFGAKNALGKEFPSGSSLAEYLYLRCGETAFDKHDLADASQLYQEKFSSLSLINEIRSQLSVGHIEDYHKAIFSLPWIRYYTTNYDEVAMFAALAEDKKSILLIYHMISINIESTKIYVYILMATLEI